ncbi:Flagellar biosynthesis protein FlhF [Alphaproteobacteria bacterium SO-S41]|nr:Flagellar biosynthesis protein FlhF [Alphaproteobacteria bacterium SO-S41]
MRVRTFTATTMPDAMAQVRAEMGEDAVILSSQRSKRGVEVKAAAERKPAQTLENIDSVYGRLAALEAELERRLVAAVAEPRIAAPRAAPETWTSDAIAARLAFHELPIPLIAKLIRTAEKLGGEPGPAWLGQALDAHLSFQPLPPSLERPIVLVGPPGAGKTACAAKLAVRSVLAGRAATLITADTSAGAANQIEAFADLIRMRVESAETPRALAAVIDRLRTEDPDRAIIVDTAGINPFDPPEMAHLRDLVEAAEAEPILVTPALGGADMEDCAMMFTALGPKRLIVTRLDIARRLGGLLQAATVSGLAFAQGAASPYIAETLEPLNPFSLARRLLTGAAEPLQAGAPS